jgi:hypothetical protein
MESNLNNFQSKLLNKFGSVPVVKNNPKILYGIGAVVVLLGIGTGYLLSGAKYIAATKVTPAIQGATEAGSADASTFKDTATGVLKSGGIKGEGTHHLERPGGSTQTVYLTSSVIDMSAFVDKKVQVWGQTVAGKRAGWLMDVGKIKVVE